MKIKNQRIEIKNEENIIKYKNYIKKIHITVTVYKNHEHGLVK